MIMHKLIMLILIIMIIIPELAAAGENKHTVPHI